MLVSRKRVALRSRKVDVSLSKIKVLPVKIISFEIRPNNSQAKRRREVETWNFKGILACKGLFNLYYALF